MEATIEIEWELIDGVRELEDASINKPAHAGYDEGDFGMFKIDAEFDCIWENDGIGSYEYWGIQGNDKGEDHLICEGWDFDKEDLHDWQIDMANDFLYSERGTLFINDLTKKEEKNIKKGKYFSPES